MRYCAERFMILLQRENHSDDFSLDGDDAQKIISSNKFLSLKVYTKAR